MIFHKFKNVTGWTWKDLKWMMNICDICGKPGVEYVAHCKDEKCEVLKTDEIGLLRTELAATKEKLAMAERALTAIANNPFCQDTCKDVAEIALKAYREVGSE